MKPPHWDAIWIGGTAAACVSNYDLIQEAAIAVKDGKIAWMGPVKNLNDKPEHLAKTVHDFRNTVMTPGLIDCHTHLVYAGNRAREFELRLKGASYEDIARQGGGIQSTVAATRAASEDELFEQSLPRAQALLRSGVTTLEIKSGYGLDWPTESKILRVAKRIETALPLTVTRTFLGAHTIPAEYRGNSDAYVGLICQKMIPAVAAENLADAVDVFCETIAFTLAQTEKIFSAARQYHLAVKCHAEQLSCSGSATLAAKYGAQSVDHLEFASREEIEAIARSGTVAVLLPGAFYYLREKQLPPVDWLREKKVPIAIASDCNPGTSPVTNLPLMMNMACTLFRLTPEEALMGVTHHAAHALGMSAQRGSLNAGQAADFAIWAIQHPAELSYQMGLAPLKQLVKAGQVVYHS